MWSRDPAPIYGSRDPAPRCGTEAPIRRAVNPRPPRCQPAGLRKTRRFRHADPCAALFAWVDGFTEEGAPEPGSYRLVAAHPRRAVEAAGGGATLAEAGLTGRQELLFAEALAAAGSSSQ